MLNTPGKLLISPALCLQDIIISLPGLFKWRHTMKDYIQRSPWRRKKWSQVRSASSVMGGGVAALPVLLRQPEPTGNMGLWGCVKEMSPLLKVKAESFQFPVKESSCNCVTEKKKKKKKMMMKWEWSLEIWAPLQTGVKARTRSQGRQVWVLPLHLNGNLTTEILHPFSEGSSDWPGSDHVWKWVWASCPWSQDQTDEYMAVKNNK